MYKALIFKEFAGYFPAGYVLAYWDLYVGNYLAQPIEKSWSVC